jgi:hypothetical protein
LDEPVNVSFGIDLGGRILIDGGAQCSRNFDHIFPELVLSDEQPSNCLNVSPECVLLDDPQQL